MAPLRVGFTNTVPRVPSPEEAEQRYYGTPSKPHFVARSSVDTWLQPTGLEAYLEPVELRPVGAHPLCSVWEGIIDVAMDAYLVGQGVQYTSLDPVRLGKVGDRSASSSIIIWVGVVPGSLSAKDGVNIAVGCRSILLANGIKDVHVEIRESVVTFAAKMYKPAVTGNPTAHVREPFSTTLGITICAADTPDIQGTAGLFFTNPASPEKLYLLTARHVLFPDEDDKHYEYHPSKPRRNVLFLGNAGFDACIKDIEKEIGGTQVIIDQLNSRLGIAAKVEDEEHGEEDEDVDKKYKERERKKVQLE